MNFFQKYDTAIKIILLILVVGNTAIAAGAWLKNNKSTSTTVYGLRQDESTKETATTTDCGEDCQDYIDKKVAEVVALQPTQAPSKETIVEKTTTIQVEKAAKQVQTTYIPVGGGETSTREVDWVSLENTKFVFDASDYGIDPTVSWDANIKVDGDSKAYVRLFDETNGIGVQGSEQTTTSNSYINLSAGPLAIWRGRNTYKVQIKSLNGAQVYYSSGRIEVVYTK
ncbi:MAG: hypothetical protein Q7S79_03610 [bacterium]|nr:hypothetical protein [bacterium]